MSADERVFWRSETCCVWVGYDDAGALAFNGLDREYLVGQEYVITVAPDQFDKLRLALRASTAVDVVDLVLAAVAEIMSSGERTWLDERDITYEFSSH